MPQDPDSRKTQELIAEITVAEWARLRGLDVIVQDLRAEVSALREQLEHLAERLERGSGATIIGGRRARVVVEIVGD